MCSRIVDPTETLGYCLYLEPHLAVVNDFRWLLSRFLIISYANLQALFSGHRLQTQRLTSKSVNRADTIYPLTAGVAYIRVSIF